MVPDWYFSCYDGGVVEKQIPPLRCGMTSVVGWIEENKDEVRELCGRKGRAVGEGRDLSGSFALERRAQDDSKN
jgi:hypothetical protein